MVKEAHLIDFLALPVVQTIKRLNHAIFHLFPPLHTLCFILKIARLSWCFHFTCALNM